jgi:hypothetical protein
MKEYTTRDRILDFVWRDWINKIEYYFAKKWLDRNFGENEYWGEVISEWYSGYKNYEDFRIARKDN